MKYLFFDIECCDGEHICEFGYVLADEKLNVHARECILINPEHGFNLTNRSHQKDLYLSFPEELYQSKEPFSEHYEKIKSVIQTPDCQIIGFSLSNDVGFLSTACDRYGLPFINFSYLDMQRLYQGYAQCDHRTSVENMLEQLEIPLLTLHKSDDDAYSILLALQKICQRLNLSVADTLTALKKKCQINEDEIAKQRKRKMYDKIISGNRKAQNDFLARQIDKFEKLPIIPIEYFAGKQVCISQIFQKTRFNEFLAIIEHLYRAGAIYNGRVSECSVYIEYNVDNNLDKRHEIAFKSIENGAIIDIISIPTVLDKLGISEQDLSKTNYLEKLQVQDKPKTPQIYTVGENRGTTLGDIFAAQGIKFDVEEE